MGKYEIRETYDINLRTQIKIANELAEANRLKRIEIDCKYGDGHTYHGEFSSYVRIEKEELEDKA